MRALPQSVTSTAMTLACLLFPALIAMPHLAWSATTRITASTPRRFPVAIVERRIDDLLAQLTLDEKVKLVGGNGFDTFEIPRLGIPSIKMTDGPLGVRAGKATAFPAGIALGATFDPALVRDVGVAIADEARTFGRNMLLGPCVNISRHPFGGRNFESYGEDPYLTGELAAEYVKGIQSRNVLASVKHFAANDQEFERMTIDAEVGTRALFEIHFPAFKRAVDAGSWTVMAAYNRINGHYASENAFLQNEVLKRLWNFQGFVVSDWGATHSTVDAANNGLDLEMPYGDFFNQNLAQAVRDGRVSTATLDDKIRRLLRAMFAIGLLGPDLVTPASPPLGPESAEHRALALRAAQDSTVLLKNQDAVLPLDHPASIALIGPNAKTLRPGGGGSSQVIPFEIASPLESFRQRLGSSVRLNYALGTGLPGENAAAIPSGQLRPTLNSQEEGLRAEYFANMTLSGAPLIDRTEANIAYASDEQTDPQLRERASVRWSGFFYVDNPGTYTMATASDDGVRLFVDDKNVIDHWSDHSYLHDEAPVELTQGWHAVRLEYYQNGGSGRLDFGWIEPSTHQPFAAAVTAARSSDVAIVFAGLGNDIESEGYDRQAMDLPPGQVELINAVAGANANTIVVLTSGNPLAMGGWIGNVKGVLQTWYPGQEGGFAIADVILGRVNPSGKLPVSFLKRWEDSPAFGNYPGQDGVVHYREGIFVGYRHYDLNRIEPQFPFGFGLSYTQFATKNLRVIATSTDHVSPAIHVEVDVVNQGRLPGAEVVQLYVRELVPSLPRPVRELKGFQKTFLQPAETRTLKFDLDNNAFSYFDEKAMAFRADPGQFAIDVGNSSRDLPLSGVIELR